MMNGDCGTTERSRSVSVEDSGKGESALNKPECTRAASKEDDSSLQLLGP